MREGPLRGVLYGKKVKPFFLKKFVFQEEIRGKQARRSNKLRQDKSDNTK
jgi:hypothetical protein